MAPAWSPDGRAIAFASDRSAAPDTSGRPGGPLFGLDIYVMDPDGSRPRRITTNGGTSPAWSPDGRHIAFVGVTNAKRDDPVAVWAGKRDIYVVGVDGTGLRNLTNHPGSNNFPTWSPDGRSIAFSSNRGDQSWAEIFVMNADGTQQRRLTFNTRREGCCEDNYPRWSPDGRWIAFISKRDGNSEVFKMRPDGSEQQQVTNSFTFNGFANWSPNSSSLVFTHRDEPVGSGSLFTMRHDGTAIRPIGIVGSYASWRPQTKR